MFDALIPDGPLHPVDALWGVGVGLFVAVAARRLTGRWISMVTVAVVAVVGVRLGNQIVPGYLDRPSPVWPVLASAAAGAMAAARPRRLSVVLVGAIAACGGVWAVVPDTEVPLIAGSVLLGAAVGVPRGVRTRWAGLLVLIPVAAAVAGSAGRPSRLGIALAMAVAGSMVAGAGAALITAWRSRQRAGTPMTVAPAATSVATTAPAATTAP